MFSVAFIVGWFDSIELMEALCDAPRGDRSLELSAEGWKLK